VTSAVVGFSRTRHCCDDGEFHNMGSHTEKHNVAEPCYCPLNTRCLCYDTVLVSLSVGGLV